VIYFGSLETMESKKDYKKVIVKLSWKIIGYGVIIVVILVFSLAYSTSQTMSTILKYLIFIILVVLIIAVRVAQLDPNK